MEAGPYRVSESRGKEDLEKRVCGFSPCWREQDPPKKFRQRAVSEAGKNWRAIRLVRVQPGPALDLRWGLGFQQRTERRVDRLPDPRPRTVLSGPTCFMVARIAMRPSMRGIGEISGIRDTQRRCF